MTIRRRRSRPSSMSLGERTGSSGGADINEDTVNDDLDLEDTPNTSPDDAVRSMLADLDPTPTEEESSSEGRSEVNQDTPPNRMDVIAQQYPEYSQEYRLAMTHRMLLRKVPLDDIARQFGVSVRTIQNYRSELFRRMREEAANLDVNELIGGTMSFYDEIIGMALRIATGDKATPNRLAAMRTAMQARKETAQWMSVSGVFDVFKFRASEDSGDAELGRLLSLTEQILADEEDLDVTGGFDSALSDMLDEQEVRLL